MARRASTFRLIYRVIFVSFCVIVACFYSGGLSKNNWREEKSKKPRNFKEHGQLFRQQQGISSLTENTEQVDGTEEQNETDLISKIARKGHVRKSDNLRDSEEGIIRNSTLKNEVIEKSSERESTYRLITHQSLSLHTPVKLTSKRLSTKCIISHSSRIKRRRSTNTKNQSNADYIHENGSPPSKLAPNFKHIAKKEIFESILIQHERSRREIDPAPESVSHSCTSFTVIQYGAEYMIFHNFSMRYRDRMYTFNEYRVTDNYLELCNSPNNSIMESWRKLIVAEKRIIASKHCNASVERSNTSDFRVEDDDVEICNVSDDGIKAIWKNRKIKEKTTVYVKCYGTSLDLLSSYVVDKQLTVYLVPTAQYFTRKNYAVVDSRLRICYKKIAPPSRQFTKDDLSMCNDSIIDIKYDNEFEVSSDFLVRYDNKTYNYTEYRVVNDGIKFCNSTDIYVQNIWKWRNYWVKFNMASKNCTTVATDAFYYEQWVYSVDKQFTVYLGVTGQYFARNNYGVFKNHFAICKGKLGPLSSEFTKKDLLMCGGDKIDIQYDEAYTVWKNFSILYKNKMYDYTKYRALNDGIKICNSTDIYIQNSWKVRNSWIQRQRAIENCSTTLVRPFVGYYTVDKHFTVYLATTGQYFRRMNYGILKNYLFICSEKLKSVSIEFSPEDLSMCGDAIIQVQYVEKYKVLENFSLLYNDKVYDDTEYRVLNDSIKICNSSDIYVKDSWKLRNSWVKNNLVNKKCPTRTPTISPRPKYDDLLVSFNIKFQGFISKTEQRHDNIVPNDFGIGPDKVIHWAYSVDHRKSRVSVSSYNSTPISVRNGSVGLLDGKFYKCSGEPWPLFHSKPVFIFLGALALSSICLLLLLIVYCVLPELRTLPGMNLMSLSIAFLLANMSLVVFISLNSSASKASYPCAPMRIAIAFCSSSILTNTAVNVYHVWKTFSGNSLVKSTARNDNLKLFLKYSPFRWGIPAIVSVVEIIGVKVGLISYSRDLYGICSENFYSAWYILSNLVLPGFLILYTIVMFIFTAHRIHQKLKASRNIASKSNIMKNRRSFVLLLKLSTTAGLTWIPFLLFMNIDFYPELKIALSFVTLLSGVYIAIAFVFTRKNYRMLKKKYFSDAES